MNLEKMAEVLYKILQHWVEPLCSYITRFNQEKVQITWCNASIAISAFKRGMLPDGDQYKELTKYQCRTMEDVLSWGWGHVKWEEDSAYQSKHSHKQESHVAKNEKSDKYDKTYQKTGNKAWGKNRGR